MKPQIDKKAQKMAGHLLDIHRQSRHETLLGYELISKGVEIGKKVAYPFAELSKQKP